MRRTLTTIAQKTAAITAGLLLLLFTTAAHSVIQPMSAHAMGDMNHGSPNVACASLCNVGIVKREGVIEHGPNQEDGKPNHAPTYFAPSITIAFLKALYPTDRPLIEPPGKVPLHKLNVVFLD